MRLTKSAIRIINNMFPWKEPSNPHMIYLKDKSGNIVGSLSGYNIYYNFNGYTPDNKKGNQ